MATKKIQILGSLVELDSTLTQENKAADAKATGDAIISVENSVQVLSDLVGETPVSEQIEAAISNSVSSSHDHNNLYYTEAEVDEKVEMLNSAISNRAESQHSHDDKYYTEVEIDSKMSTLNSAISDKASSSHTHDVATTSTAGFMSVNDKEKLDSIAAGANAYTLPSAGTSLGGVKSGGDVTISNGVITVNDDSHSHVIANIDGLQNTLDGKASTGHSHDDKYYTEAEVDAKIDEMSNAVADLSDTVSTNYDESLVDLSIDGTIITCVKGDGSEYVLETQDTTYSAGTGISLSGTTFSNSGVRSITTGFANGTISVNTNGDLADIAVKGLGSAAYTESTAYDVAGTAKTKADEALGSAKTYTDTKVAELVNSAPETMDTLKEVAEAIAAHQDVTDALNAAIGAKANASDLTAHTSNKSNPHNVTLSQLGAVAKSGDTMTGELLIRNANNTGHLRLYGSTEGGNIQIQGPDNTHYWEMDALANDQLRMYCHDITNNKNYGFWTLSSDKSTTFPGKIMAPRAHFTSGGDASETALGDVALRLGAEDGWHMDLDNNEIIAKNDATTMGTLYLQGLTLTEGGNITEGTWNGSAIAVNKGGTGATTAAAACEKLGAVKKSGDTMTGTLKVANSLQVYGDAWRSIGFETADGKDRASMMISNTNVIHFNVRETGATYADRYKLPNPTAGKTAESWYDILTTKNAVTIAQGGTGATTAANARKNLAVPYYAKYDAGNLQTGAGDVSAWITYYGDDGTSYNQMDLGKTATSFYKPVNVASGGTGATTASGALTNLGAVSLETFNNRRVGGRNLLQCLPLSKMPFGTGDSSGSDTKGTVSYDAYSKSLCVVNNNSNLRLWLYSDMPVKPNETYTISCWTASDKQDPTAGEPYQFQISAKLNSGSSIYYSKDNTNFKTFSHADTSGNGWGWKIISQTFTTPNDCTNISVAFRTGYDYQNYTNKFFIKNFKIEQSPVYTDWCPAPEELLTIEGGSTYESLQIGTGKSRHLNLWAGDDGVTKIGHQDASWLETNAIYLYDDHTYFKQPIQIVSEQFWESGTTNGDKYGIDMRNSDIMNANGIYFQDDANAAGEGLNFARGTNTWDSLLASGGKLYFAPNRAKGSVGTRYEVYHSGGATIPVSKGGTGKTTFTSGQALIGNGTGAIDTRAITDNTAVGALISSSSWTSNNSNLVTLNTLAFWNGAHAGNNSNLSKLATVTAGTWQASTIGVAYGGTGATTAAGARTNLQVPHLDGKVINLGNNQVGIGLRTDNGGWWQFWNWGNDTEGYYAALAPTLNGKQNLGTSSMYIKNVYANNYIGSTLSLSSTADASETANNSVCIRTGSATGQHLDIDNNEIISKTDASTMGDLYLQGMRIAASGKITSGTWNGSAIGVAYGGTGVTTTAGLRNLVHNSYSDAGITNTVDVFTLAPGIYHCEDTTSTDKNYPIAESRATVEVFGQHRAGTAAGDGYPNGYWTVRITYASGKQFTNHRCWSAWSGWKTTYNSSSVIYSSSQPTGAQGMIWLKPIS